MKKRNTVLILFFSICFAICGFSQNEFPIDHVEVYGQTTWLRKDSVAPGGEPYRYQSEVTFEITMTQAANDIVATHIKLGDSPGSENYFKGKVSRINNTMAGTYYDSNGNKHYLKIYIENIPQSSIKNYSIQFESTGGQLSTSFTGTLPQ